MELPDGVYEEGGRYYRDVERRSLTGEQDEDGNPLFNIWMKKRPVALTFAEAKLRHWDFYNSELRVWILEGYKREKDWNPADLMADASTTVVATPEQQERELAQEGA
jgi:hypothetical protein